ncbi:MAG: extracellular solute-binding protein, partial [Lachnospiraceae bacterium]|nr:extracellular solute-binding protein [Lachnospiraceae bacterium]
MGKRIWGLFSGILCAAALTGCGAAEEPVLENTEPQKVELVVWGAEEDTELMNQIIQSFQINYQGQADFQISFAVQGESQCKDVLLGGLEDGADVFTFADDQLNALAAAGALDPIGNADEIMSRNLSSTVEAATVNDRLYAYPLTADNGYFLYYNKRYITEEQVKTLDGILEAAAANDKLFTMDWSSAWYVYSFFGNTGLQVGLNDDGITNYCTWNQTDGDIRGIDVAQAMLRIAENPGFVSCTDEEFLNGVRDGSVIAGVSGVWNSVAVEEAWGEDAGAAKLPTYSCGGSQVQMASFSGCKLIGVNAYSEYP